MISQDLRCILHMPFADLPCSKTVGGQCVAPPSLSVMPRGSASGRQIASFCHAQPPHGHPHASAQIFPEAATLADSDAGRRWGGADAGASGRLARRPRLFATDRPKGGKTGKPVREHRFSTFAGFGRPHREKCRSMLDRKRPRIDIYFSSLISGTLSPDV
jgi:hypothetical protein